MSGFRPDPDWARAQRGQPLWPVWRSVIVAAAAGVLVFAASVTLMWLVMDRPATTTTRLGAAEQLDLVRIGLIMTGGIGGLVALVVAYRKQRVAERSDGRDEIALREANYKLFNELFHNTSLLLGNPSAAVRLAGVYGMAELADGWPAFRRLCVDVLHAYLRTPVVGDTDAKLAEQEVRESLLKLLETRSEGSAGVDTRPSLGGAERDGTQAQGGMGLPARVRSVRQGAGASGEVGTSSASSA
ncbi:hypothetical protein [Actinoplanes sp. NPDC026623]|uniref:hypothetical protein n=1 Tax=Actinoplanes sp. NPDC026623 TaxID=3155610 RepID=UPI0033C78AC9